MSIMNLLPVHQHHPKYVFEFGVTEGKEPKTMQYITDIMYTEIQNLSENGTPITLPDGQEEQVHVFLGECVCDSEGKGKLGGHKSKNHRMPCMKCKWVPRRGPNKMHAHFNMTEQEIVSLRNGDFDRNPNFPYKAYMEKYRDAKKMKVRKEYEQATGMSGIFPLV